MYAFNNVIKSLSTFYSVKRILGWQSKVPDVKLWEMLPRQRHLGSFADSLGSDLASLNLPLGH